MLCLSVYITCVPFIFLHSFSVTSVQQTSPSYNLEKIELHIFVVDLSFYLLLYTEMQLCGRSLSRKYERR